MAQNINKLAEFLPTCIINGRVISIISGEVYVNGIHYVPESDVDGKHRALTAGKDIKRKFHVKPDFDTILMKGFVDVVFTQSENDDDFEVRGKMAENLMEEIDIQVLGGTLIISTRHRSYENIVVRGKAPTIYVTNKRLKDVSLYGTGDFFINDNLDAPDGFTARNSGAGDITCGFINARNGDVSLLVSGSGDIDLEAVESNFLNVSLTGSADIDCGTAKTKICTIDLKGHGDVAISGSTDSVNLSIEGSGDINAGDFVAQTGKASIAGCGDISCNVKSLSDRVRGHGDIHNKC